jgi:hypothetical protein
MRVPVNPVADPPGEEAVFFRPLKNTDSTRPELTVKTATYGSLFANVAVDVATPALPASLTIMLLGGPPAVSI